MPMHTALIGDVSKDSIVSECAHLAFPQNVCTWSYDQQGIKQGFSLHAKPQQPPPLEQRTILPVGGGHFALTSSWCGCSEMCVCSRLRAWQHDDKPSVTGSNSS